MLQLGKKHRPFSTKKICSHEQKDRCIELKVFHFCKGKFFH